MGLVGTSVLPKYTQYELSTLISREVEKSAEHPTLFAKQYEVSSDVLLDILNQKVIFKLRHYDAASKILDIDLDELLSEIECNETIFFRSEESDDNTKEFVNKTKAIFTEWIHQKKIYGDI